MASSSEQNVFELHPGLSTDLHSVPFHGQMVLNGTDTLHFVSFPVNRQVGRFQFGAIINNAAKNIHVKVSV